MSTTYTHPSQGHIWGPLEKSDRRMKNWLHGVYNGTTSQGTAEWLRDTVGFTVEEATMEYLRQEFERIESQNFLLPIKELNRVPSMDYDSPGGAMTGSTGIRAHILRALEGEGLHTGSGGDDTFICFYDWLNTGYTTGELTTGTGDDEAFNWTGCEFA